MRTALSSRPQQKQAEPNGASRYDARGQLWVKYGNWMTYPRFVASRYSEARGVKLTGVRVEVADTARAPIPCNLTVKPRGGQRVPLKVWVKAQS